MNRVIKFRFWCDEHGYVGSGTDCPVSEVYFNHCGEIGLPCPLCHKSRPMLLQQYIGGTDMNGIYMFEGDIIQTKKTLPDGNIFDFGLSEIKWLDDSLKWSISDYYDRNQQSKSITFEIVGTALENKELLSKS